MRFIDKNDVELLLPPDWAEQVQNAWIYVDGKIDEAKTEAELEGKTADEIEEIIVEVRKKAIKAKASLWSRAGECIKEVMHSKCWYCETSQIRSDMPVDHFRPKNRVAECQDHPGYWWLAFDWENYRYSCTYCNERRIDVVNGTDGGKWDHFPIFQPPPWVTTETGDWHLERPKLLDPMNLDDTKLVTFHENGFSRETYQDDGDENFIRAKESIGLYHLNHIRTVRARKTIAISIKNNFNRIQQLLTLDQTNPIIIDEIRQKKAEIIRSVRQNAPFSTAAKIYLQGYRSTGWVEELLARDL